MPTIEVKEAVGRAKATLRSLYEDDPPKELALEEIELVIEGTRELWSVTLGFQRRKTVTAAPLGGISALFPNPPAPPIEHRVYKTVYIDANSGEFVKMDMRLVQ